MQNLTKQDILYKYLNEQSLKIDGEPLLKSFVDEPFLIPIYAAMEEFRWLSNEHSKDRIKELEEALRQCKNAIEYFAKNKWKKRLCAPHAAYINNVLVRQVLHPEN